MRFTMNRLARILVPPLSICLIAGPALSAASEGIGSEYVIGVGDELAVDVWQEQSLSSTATVANDGKILLPAIGPVDAAGETPSGLGREIARRLSNFNPRISQVTVRVVGYRSRSVSVLGEVASPGRYGFAEIPDLLAVLGEAGGPTPEARLSEVVIVHGDGNGETREVVDLERYIEAGEPSSLPGLRPGDTVFVPGATEGASLGRNVVYVYGEVRDPGIYPLSDGADVVEALLMAGGTTEQADDSDVKVISRSSHVRPLQIDVPKLMNQGSMDSVPKLRPGDTVVVGRRSEFWSGFWDRSREVTLIVSAVASLYFSYHIYRSVR